jgi:hypothetical protein
VKGPPVVVEAKEKGADAVARLVHTVAADDAVRGVAVLDLEHHPLARHVRTVKAFGYDTVEAHLLELVEPRARHLGVLGCCGGDGAGAAYLRNRAWVAGGGQQRLDPGAPL